MAINKPLVLTVIAGHNGAGKSSVGPSLLPPEIAARPIFDGDQAILKAVQEALRETSVRELAQEMGYANASKLFLDLCQKALEERAHFAYEGHFIGENSFDVIRQFKAAGYQTSMVFMGLDSLEQSKDRVAQRTAMGGHYVAPWVVAFNYETNPRLIDSHLALLNQLTIYDTSGIKPVPLVQYGEGQLLYKAASLPQWLRQGMPSLLAHPLVQAQRPEQHLPKQRTPGKDEGFSY